MDDYGWIDELFDELGVPATLSIVSSTRAARGGEITETTTDTTVLIAIDVDQSLFGVPADRHVIQLYLKGAAPSTGDTLTLSDGAYRVEAVDKFWADSSVVAWKVMVS